MADGSRVPLPRWQATVPRCTQPASRACSGASNAQPEPALQGRLGCRCLPCCVSGLADLLAQRLSTHHGHSKHGELERLDVCALPGSGKAGPDLQDLQAGISGCARSPQGGCCSQRCRAKVASGCSSRICSSPGAVPQAAGQSQKLPAALLAALIGSSAAGLTAPDVARAQVGWGQGSSSLPPEHQ